MKYNTQACLNLATMSVATFFEPLTETKNRTKEHIKDIKAERLKDVNGKLIDMFCDCSNFEANKLRKKIIKFNK